MEQYYNILHSCALFNNIDKSCFSPLMQCLNSHTKSYDSDEYVFFLGDKVNYISVILTGTVELTKENLAGNRHIVAFLGPTHLFGEGIVCTKERTSPVTVRVKEKAQILFIPYERVIKSCGNACSFHLQLVSNMMLILGEKNHILNHKIDMLMLKGMREKIATYLLQESSDKNLLSFDISPNRLELAEYLNVSRTSMCRELARMKEEGIIDYYQNSFKIVSLISLKNCLDNG